VNLRGAVVVVTGASSGIGEVTAVRFGSAGARVVLAARRLDRLEIVAERIRARGGDALPVRCYVTSRDDLAALAERVRDGRDRVDVLVNNAGIPGGGPFAVLSEEQIERVIRVNVLGVMGATKAFLPMFLERGSGHIVNVASIAGRFATPGSSVYGASKHAVIAFSESLAYELGPLGIRVTSVNPGFTRTEGFPMRGVPSPLVMEPERVARTIVDIVERGRGPEVSVPRWISALQTFRVLTPPLYRWGVSTVLRLAGRRVGTPAPPSS
jgi:NAD(P)-dependent dehydrogenase (short-subunit alcohol dehydrogenase family)